MCDVTESTTLAQIIQGDYPGRRGGHRIGAMVDSAATATNKNWKTKIKGRQYWWWYGNKGRHHFCNICLLGNKKIKYSYNKIHI